MVRHGVFIESTTDGRVIFSKSSNNEIEMKYLLLNPSTSFQEVVESARSVVLAGGTMSPVSSPSTAMLLLMLCRKMSDVIVRLFPSLPSERLTTFSCGHIVPQSSVQTLIMTKGPSGLPLEFKHAQQNDIQILKELGQIVLNLCSIIPRGLVVFFPSYFSLGNARKAWGAAHLLEKFGMKKKVGVCRSNLRLHLISRRCSGNQRRAIQSSRHSELMLRRYGVM